MLFHGSLAPCKMLDIELQGRGNDLRCRLSWKLHFDSCATMKLCVSGAHSQEIAPNPRCRASACRDVTESLKAALLASLMSCPSPACLDRAMRLCLWPELLRHTGQSGNWALETPSHVLCSRCVWLLEEQSTLPLFFSQSICRQLR